MKKILVIVSVLLVLLFLTTSVTATPQHRRHRNWEFVCVQPEPICMDSPITCHLPEPDEKGFVDETTLICNQAEASCVLPEPVCKWVKTKSRFRRIMRHKWFR